MVNPKEQCKAIRIMRITSCEGQHVDQVESEHVNESQENWGNNQSEKKEAIKNPPPYRPPMPFPQRHMKGRLMDQCKAIHLRSGTSYERPNMPNSYPKAMVEEVMEEEESTKEEQSSKKATIQ